MVKKRTDSIKQVEETKEVYVAHANLLKGRGWTEKLIKMFLTDPCKVVPNPHYKSASPMRLYKLSKVEQCESLENFQEYLISKQASRQKASEAARERARIAREILIKKLAQTRSFRAGSSKL